MVETILVVSYNGENRKVGRLMQKVMSFDMLRQPKILGGIPTKEGSAQIIIDKIKSYGIKTSEFTINKQKLLDFQINGEYLGEFSEYYPWNQFQKTMEHFSVAEILELSEDDIYIDIANQYSPVPIIYNRIFGCQTYKQDLDYPIGFHGDTIGGDAANMDIPDEFCTKMGLHCSFEHFEGNSDKGFIREAYRVLKPGGSVVFAPLYIAEDYCILTDPDIAVEQNVEFEEDAILCCHVGYNNRHGRFYSPQKIKERVFDQAPFLVEFIRITNSHEIKPDTYLGYALKLTRPL